MRTFVCFKCGNGSLVRSNFKLTSDRKPYCRSEENCREREAKKPSKSYVCNECLSPDCDGSCRNY